jgi:processive 1,2-diacylglycerol beta-glucosyltransferase
VTAARVGDRKSILIFSASFGGPHGIAADALAAYLREKHPRAAEVHVIDFLERCMPSVNVLARFGYQQSLQFFPFGRGSLPELAALQPDNPVIQELSAGGLERARGLLAEMKPDAVISVLPTAAAVVSETGSGCVRVSASVLTDFSARGAWLHPDTDVHFVATRDAADELVLEGVAWNRVSVSGLPTITAPVSSPRSVRRKALGIADRFTVALLAPAGSGSELADLAASIAGSGIQVAVSLAESPRLARRLAAATKASALVRSFGKEPGWSAVCEAADLVISRAGGATAPLAISLGLPLILYNPVPGQERPNVDFLVNCGAGLLARDEADVVEKARFLSTHPARLEQMAADSRALSHADAAAIVCERVLAALVGKEA